MKLAQVLYDAHIFDICALIFRQTKHMVVPRNEPCYKEFYHFGGHEKWNWDESVQ